MELTYKEARINAGYSTQYAISKAMEMDEMTYNLKENYKRHFKDYELMKFCKLTKVKPSNLKILSK